MWVIGAFLTEYKGENYWWKNEKPSVFTWQSISSSFASPHKYQIVEDLKKINEDPSGFKYLAKFFLRISVFHYVSQSLLHSIFD